MKLDVQVKNFGKISDAKVKLRPFTVIAGPNSSGKSFVTKALYGFFYTASKDHLSQVVWGESLLIKSFFKGLETAGFDDDEALLVEQFLAKLDEFNNKLSHAELWARDVDDLKLSFEAVINKLGLSGAGKGVFGVATLDDIIKIFKNPKSLIQKRIENGFAASLQDNFQVQQLSELKNYQSNKEDIASFDFGSLGCIEFNQQGEVSARLSNLEVFQTLHNTVFLESPIYWKIKNALEFARKERGKLRFNTTRQQEVLTGIPQHFYDLVDLLDTRVKINPGDGNDDSLFDAINKEIGGELDVSQSGDIYFKENGYPQGININSTASGITNIGLIALLLKRHVIAKGSMLFVDEPEVNLHPAWQKVMVETLYKLSQAGINVVIASHSIDMMKAIENIMAQKEADKLDEHFGINQLSRDGKSINEDMPAMKKIATIKADLGKPFYDMSLESQWS